MDSEALRHQASNGRTRMAPGAGCRSPGRARTPAATTASRAMALVITLIMLAIITFMAVTFLVLSHRERGAVTTTTDQATARFAAESSLERAKQEILTRIFTHTNDQDFGLIVSTNFINRSGFFPNAVDYRTNVNYEHTGAGVSMAAQPRYFMLSNLTNLLYDPRPPVVVTNHAVPNSQELRFYLDLNRNDHYDTNGFLPVLSPDPTFRFYDVRNGNMIRMQNEFVASNFFVGDPEWIGVLEHPEQPHSANNKFISRYAYLVVPAGKTLDVNFIHNDAGLDDINAGDAAYRRNMGVGSWEINLAAFLADLNTNLWNAELFPASTAYYQYRPLSGARGNVRGLAFEDAQALLHYRYAYANPPWSSLKSLNESFPLVNGTPFTSDLIDEFGGRGPLGAYLTGNGLPPQDSDLGREDEKGWPGADNPNHYFSTQELFERTSIDFSNRLVSVARTANGSTNSSYNRYTFYRMLAQLGSDSAPEEDKMNLNYRNVDISKNYYGVGKPVSGAETNLLPWTPASFFNNAANHMLRAYTREWRDENHSNYFGTFGLNQAFGVTNIPVFIVTNYFTETNVANLNGLRVTNIFTHYVSNNLAYTPAVHRILQLAANMHDATWTSLTNESYPYLPHVYRPIFRRDEYTNIFIVGYREVRDDLLAGPNVPFLDLDVPVDRGDVPLYTVSVRSSDVGSRLNAEPMIYGIPLIIGARKGLPNFNEFSMQNIVEVTRKLQFKRQRGDQTGPIIRTNQMYILTVSNTIFGVEAWNSYSNAYPRNLRMNAVVDLLMSITNEVGGHQNVVWTNWGIFGYVTNVNANNWRGWLNDEWNFSPSMKIPISNNITPLSNSVWRPYRVQREQIQPLSYVFEDPSGFPVPHWWFNLKVRVRYYLIDLGVSPNRIIDYVNLSHTENAVDISAALQHLAGGPKSPNTLPPDGSGNPWGTNRFGTTDPTDVRFPTYGIMNQYYRGESKLGDTVADPKYVHETAMGSTYQYAIDNFRNQFVDDPNVTRTIFPENAGKRFSKTNTFYAPLNPVGSIHMYVTWQANDPLVHYTIGDLVRQEGGTNVTITGRNPPLENLAIVNQRYEPWVDGSEPANPASLPTSNTRMELALKDPLVRKSDDWAFPTNRYPNEGWLGRVHRGTPWQTIYLKASEIDPGRWTNWSGNTPRFYLTDQYDVDYNYVGRTINATGLDYTNTMPSSDRMLFDLFTTALNRNATRGQLSVNQTNLAAWSAVLSGAIVLTNTSESATLNAGAGNVAVTPQYEPFVIPPAGPYNFASAVQPPLIRIVNSINDTRTNFPNKTFQRVGDILAVPELSAGYNPVLTNHYVGVYPDGHWRYTSPFLHLGDPAASEQGNNYVAMRGISDQAYERLPEQILGLLRVEREPRFVVYAYGQTLRPAPASIYTGGGFRGLCTNYQVTAEIATRAVVRVEGSFDPQFTNDLARPYPDPSGRFYPPHVVVEQFNVLPPD